MTDRLNISTKQSLGHNSGRDHRLSQTPQIYTDLHSSDKSFRTSSDVNNIRSKRNIISVFICHYLCSVTSLVGRVGVGQAGKPALPAFIPLHKLYVGICAHLCLVAAVLLLAACTEPSEPVEPIDDEQQMPIAISASITDEAPGSRSATQLYDAGYDAFYIYAYKHLSASTQTVMPGYTVKYDAATGWHYSDLTDQFLKYWDASALTYDFQAYTYTSPLHEGVSITENTDHSGFIISGVKGNVSSDPGFLVSHMQRDISTLIDKDCYNNQTIEASQFYSDMPIRFHSIISSVEFRIFNSGSEDGYMTSATVGIADNNKYYITGQFSGDDWTFPSDAESKSNIFSIAYSTEVLLEKEKTNADAISISKTFEIPQDFGKKIIVSFVINNTPLVATFELPENWLIGNNYIYYINLNVANGEPILIDLTAEDFTPGFEIDEKEVYDW